MADSPGRYNFDGIDRVLHEKARLGILTSLVGRPQGLAFGDLQRLCGLTQGNLSRHLSVLEEAGFVRIEKGFEGRRPRTGIQLTADGRKRFLAYLDVLESVVRDAAERARAGRADAAPRPPPRQLREA